MVHPLAQIAALLLFAATLPLTLELAWVTLGNFRAWVFPTAEAKHNQANAPLWPGVFTIIVPAHNEQLLIQRTVASLRAAADLDPLCETKIFVIAHNCTDDTARLARAARADVMELNEDSGKGKGRALEVGFATALDAGANAVAVVDADSIASANLVAALRAALAAAPAAQCRYELESGPEFTAAANLQALAFRAINVLRARGRAALGLSCGIFGNGFALRAETLRAVPYGAFSIAEDLEYHIALVSRGMKVEYTGAAQMTGAGASGKAAVAQRSRWEGGRLRVARENLVPLMGKVLRGQLRLLEPILDLTGLPMALGVFLLLISLAIPGMPLKLYAALALAVVALHVLTAILASPSPRAALNLLARVPFYILWKVALVPRILQKSRRNAAWERSTRNATNANTVTDHRIL